MNGKGEFGRKIYLCSNVKAEVNILMISLVHTSLPVDPPDIKLKTINKMLCGDRKR